MATRCTDSDVDHDFKRLIEPRQPSARAVTEHREKAQSGATCAVTVDLSAYGSLVHRVHDRLVAEEAEAGRDRAQGDALFDELMELAPKQREEAVVSDLRFANFFLCDRLLDDAARLERTDRAEANELAFLALAAAGRIDARSYGRSLIADLEARAWALLGEAWYGSGEAGAGRTALRLARNHLRDGSGDPLEEAEILYREAVASHAASPEQALAAVDRAAAIFLEHGERSRLGEALVRKGVLSAAAGDHRTAVPLLREALALLDGRVPARRLAEIGWQATRSLLAEGAADEAWTEIARARSHLRDQPDELLEARLRFLEGKIATLAGLDQEAITCMLEARDALLRLGKGEEAARAHLAWVALTCRDGLPSDDRAAAGEALAAETERLLATAGLRRETVMVLLLVDRAAAGGTLLPDLVTALDRFLDASA